MQPRGVLPARGASGEELNRDYEDAPWLTVLVKLSGFLTVFVGSYAAMDLLFNLGHRVTAWGPPALILSALAGAHLSE